VVVDIFVNDTAWYADYVLPETTYLERFDPVHVLGNRVFLRQPVVEPFAESKSALWIYRQLGERLGLGDYFQYEDEVDYIKQQIAPYNVDFETFRQVGYFDVPFEEPEPGYTWNTPSGKIELASSTLANAGFAAVPQWEEPPRPAEGEFYLLTGKVAQHTQFGTQNNQFLKEVTTEPRLWINTSAAKSRRIGSNDLVLVKSPVGEVTVKVFVTEAIRADCVYLTPGFGHSACHLHRSDQRWAGALADFCHRGACARYRANPAGGASCLTRLSLTPRAIPS
jgi:thiosulfate reductase / polysulfide reductase chain A